ncbi:MAG: AzlC family ABC transporter permease [Actinobacteria bacterium]|nr:AzlC family ABC transporter permease [Actinomycetota bacterium]
MTATATPRDVVNVAPAAGAARAALQDTAPFAVALVPFGFAVGVAATHAGLSATENLAGALVMLAGAAQLAVVESIGRGEGIWLAVLVTLLINLRFVLYGAGIAEWFANASRLQRLLLVFPVVDQSFMICQQRFRSEADLAWRRRYYLTTTALLAGCFVGAQALALGFGDVLPDGAGLHLAAPLAFAGMLAKSVHGRTELVVATTAAIALVVVAGTLGPAALPAAVVVGVVTGARMGRTS